MSESERTTPYGSAEDLPSVVELRNQLRGLKALTRVIGRGTRHSILRTEHQLNKLVREIDAFYALLGPRNWIYHELLSTDAIAALLAKPADEAERALINHYKEPDRLSFMIQVLRRRPAMGSRFPLIERALHDYVEERYYGTTLLLIAAMDGFVNDLDTAQRRGLHTRDEAELSAWDSVVGHHLGLTHAHRTFTRSFRRLSNEPVHELYRNGIVHGMLTNFDNDVVATKAWNRLFAVNDWAASLEKQSTPKEPRPTWSDIFSKLRQNTANRRALEAWRPRLLTPANPEFEDEPVYRLTFEFLTHWRSRNYGKMAAALASLTQARSHGATAGRIRDEYGLFVLEGFDITHLDFAAAAVCNARVQLTLRGDSKPGQLRWIREDDTGDVVMPNQAGAWRLMSWGPWAMLNPLSNDETFD